MILPNQGKSNIKVCVIANINHLDQCKGRYRLCRYGCYPEIQQTTKANKEM